MVSAAGIVGQCHVAASATIALSVAVPEAFTAACHTAFQSWRSCGIDSHRAAHLAVRWHLEGEGHVRAIVETVPCALAVGTGLLGRAARNAGTVLEATDGHYVATSDVELLALFGVGIYAHFRLGGCHGEHVAALDVTVAVGVQSIVAAAVGHHIAAADGHVTGRIDGVVARFGIDVAASDGQGAFRLDALVAGRLGVDCAAIDDKSAIGLDGLG